MDIVERLDEHLRFNGKDQLSRDAKSAIERLREALKEINKRNPFHNVSPPMDRQYYAQIITEMVSIANTALKEGE